MSYTPPDLANTIYLPSTVTFPLLLIKRGTRSELETAKSAYGLLASEPYLITDEGRFAIGTSLSTYTDFAKKSEVVDLQTILSELTVASSKAKLFFMAGW